MIDDDDYSTEDDCDHEDYEADILTGSARCCRCGHSWWQTKEEIEAERLREQVYAEAPARLVRDDEIPF